MSNESNQSDNVFIKRWQNLLDEKNKNIEQLQKRHLYLQESNINLKDQSSDDSVEEQFVASQELLLRLQNDLAKVSKDFERRFDVISQMDIDPLKEDNLKKVYFSNEISQEANTFILFRIIGNDLYPRHSKGQSQKNLRFILENEKTLKNCQKKWIVNRIADPTEEAEIIALLKEFEQDWVHVPFLQQEYQDVPFDFSCLPFPGYLASNEFSNFGPEQKQRLITALYRLKNNYVMNNNGARNIALAEGRSRAKWILPWDGNCFLTPRAWQRITEDIIARPWLKYFAVPMARVLDNQSLIEDYFQPEAVEEPQLVFRKDSIEDFNENFCYGRRPKVELFWRLGIPGKWDRWRDDLWDQPRREPSVEEKQFGVAGWVARLYSGMSNLEQDNHNSFKQRGLARQEAIVSTLQKLDLHHLSKSGQDYQFGIIDEKALKEELQQYHNGEVPLLQRRIDQLLLDAENALKRGPFSVVKKTTLPPSGDIHDYWHPAPYWWPNPSTEDGLPYIRRDGERVPGTRLYEKDSDKYDRTRVQRLFDDGLALALAWYFENDDRYADHAVRTLRCFFIDPKTRMNPHLRYAQVRMGHKKNQGMSTGIIEFKDFYFYLDAVRILMRSPVFTHNDIQNFKKWLEEYLAWLLTSAQGIKECQADNNHGTYYDLQVASIAAFLDRHDVLYETLMRAQSRISCQIAPDGSQPEELTRATTQHYCCYNFQGWVNLAEISSRWGINLWQYTSQDGRSLKKAAEWLLDLEKRSWPFEQIEEFDKQRFYPIAALAHSNVRGLNESALLPSDPYALKSIFFAHDGIRPYWNIGQERKSIGFSASKKPHVFFAIPLKSKSSSSNWQLVVKNLDNTLRSISASDEKGFSVVIAGHDRPEIEKSFSSIVTYLACDFPPPSSYLKGSYDKRKKLKLIGDYISSQVEDGEGCYVHVLDADDLVDDRLVKYIIEHNNFCGFYVSKGYKFDMLTHSVAETNNFYTRCGSCLIGYFLKDEVRLNKDANNSYFGLWIERQHKNYPYFIKNNKIELTALPFRAVTYFINHSESLQMATKKFKPFAIDDVVMEKDQAISVMTDNFSYDFGNYNQSN